jgi:alpha-galactosidase
MPKIAMLGAGSLIFCKTLINDFLATPALNASEICLMSITRPKLEKMEAFVKRMIAENRFQARVWSTLDRREALKDADYVIVMIQVGGIEAFQKDYEIPMKYGVDQCVADSLGPGGVFRGMRTIPVLIDIVREMEELCPNALLLNYANPMGANCMALGRAASQIQFVGLCHGVQTTLDLISRYVEVPKDQVDFLCAGINHMAWFLSLHDRRDGRDLYPLLRANCEKPEYYVTEKVRCEVMRNFGYFMTESTGHLSEYVPWFRSHERSLKRYCDQPSFGGETGAYYKYCSMIAQKYEKVDYLTLETSKVEKRSVEYCSYILEAAETGVPFKLNGNVRNDGYVTNLPGGCCVEVPLYVDRQGIHPLRVGALPPQCAALNQTNINVQTLAVEAAFSGNPEFAVQAIAMDPLTSAVCTLDEIRAMTSEMLEAQRRWLPRFSGKSIAPRPILAIPDQIAPVDVPLDPALAIANRFGRLAMQDTKS